MKIKEEGFRKIKFDDLSLGSVFFVEGSYYMKTDTANIYEEDVNCVDLETGFLGYYIRDAEVYLKPNATLVIDN